MGHLKFGTLAKIRGTTKYHLSPFYQRPFADMMRVGFPNVFFRIRSNIFTVVPPFLVGYLIYQTAEREHDRLQRKKPGEFDHET